MCLWCIKRLGTLLIITPSKGYYNISWYKGFVRLCICALGCVPSLTRVPSTLSSSGCRAVMSRLPSSATRTGSDCISWLITTTVTVVSAHIIKVRLVTNISSSIRFLCVVNDSSFTVDFRLLAFTFSTVSSAAFFPFRSVHLTVFPIVLPLTPFNYACWLQSSCLFPTYSLSPFLASFLSLSGSRSGIPLDSFDTKT